MYGAGGGVFCRPTRWSTTLSSTVKLPHAVILGLIWSRNTLELRENGTLVLHRVGCSAFNFSPHVRHHQPSEWDQIVFLIALVCTTIHKLTIYGGGDFSTEKTGWQCTLRAGGRTDVVSPLLLEGGDLVGALVVQRLHRNVQQFRGGLVFKAHRLCASLNSRLERNKEEEGRTDCVLPLLLEGDDLVGALVVLAAQE